jgi:hypothetical protein
VGFFDALRDVFARAEHEQQIGGFYRCGDQMAGVDVGNLGFGR